MAHTLYIDSIVMSKIRIWVPEDFYVGRPLGRL